MASLSNAVTIIVVFAILIQFLVDRVKELVGDKVMNIVKAPVWAVAFGALFALMFDIDFFALMGYSSQLPIIARRTENGRERASLVLKIFKNS